MHLQTEPQLPIPRVKLHRRKEQFGSAAGLVADLPTMCQCRRTLDARAFVPPAGTTGLGEISWRKINWLDVPPTPVYSVGECTHVRNENVDLDQIGVSIEIKQPRSFVTSELAVWHHRVTCGVKRAPSAQPFYGATFVARNCEQQRGQRVRDFAPFTERRSEAPPSIIFDVSCAHLGHSSAFGRGAMSKYQKPTFSNLQARSWGSLSRLCGEPGVTEKD
jgi:hypothetical protein